MAHALVQKTRVVAAMDQRVGRLDQVHYGAEMVRDMPAKMNRQMRGHVIRGAQQQK